MSVEISARPVYNQSTRAYYASIREKIASLVDEVIRLMQPLQMKKAFFHEKI